MASVPRKKSRTAQQDRIHFHQARASQKFLAGEHMQHLASQYFGTLERNLEAVGLQEETWAEFPDLFAFLQDHVSRSAIESIMGSKILELNPDLIENFWTFDNNVPPTLSPLHSPPVHAAGLPRPGQNIGEHQEVARLREQAF